MGKRTRTASSYSAHSRFTMASRVDISLDDVERDYPAWLASASARSGRGTFHEIHDVTDFSQCFLGGCDVDSQALNAAGVTHILSLISRNQTPAASDDERLRGASLTSKILMMRI